MEKKVLPWSYLVLYAKHWIKFPEINDDIDENKFWKELKYILYMCDYMPCTKNDCVYLVSKAADEIRKFYKDNGKDVLVYGLNNLTEIVNGIDEWQDYFYNEKIDYKTALVYHILSKLSMLTINDCIVGYVDYKKLKAKIDRDNTSLTYTECQNKFDKTFKDLMSEESYKLSDRVIYTINEYIRN